MQKNKHTIYFRADADETIGLGHVIRILALISYLRDKFRCVFVIKNSSKIILDTIKIDCSDIVVISNENEFFSIIKSKDIIVLDGYIFDEQYQLKVKKYCCKLVCIDDIANRTFVSDVIINHGEGISKNDYSCQQQTKIYLGLKYALLRKPFLLASVASKRAIDEISTYFVCFGGSDNENFTQNTVEQLIGIADLKKINVVIGSEYMYADDLFLYCKSIISCEINIYRNLNAEEMVNIMLDSHLAIVPSSSISYEALSVKMLIITGYTVNNQKSIYDSLIEKEVALGIGKFPINNISSYVEIIKKTKNRFIKNQSQIFDGKSNERLLTIFKELCNEK